MRGQVSGQAALWSYLSPEARVPATHPIRPIKQMADAALQTLERTFEAMYSRVGRPSIPPGAAPEGAPPDRAVFGPVGPAVL
jgi:hypothetical protein